MKQVTNMQGDHSKTPSDAVTLLTPLAINSLFLVLYARVPPMNAIWYALFQLFFFIVPSYGLCSAVLRMGLRPLESVILGYPLAHCLFFALFWIGALARLPHLPFLLPFAGLVVGVHQFLKSHPATDPPMISRQAFLALCTVGLAALFGFTLDLRPPIGTETVFIYKDYELATGKLFSLMRFLDGMPLTDFRIQNFGFSYHVFQMMPQAFFAWISGVSPYTVAFALDPQYTWIFITGAALVGSRVLAGQNQRTSLLTAVFLFFCTGLGWLGFHNFQLLASPLTYFFAFPFFLLFVFYAQGYLSGRLGELNYIYVAGLFLAAAGSKSVLGMLLPLALAPVFLVRLAQRRLNRRYWLLLALMLGAVLLLKVTMYSSTGQALLRPKGWAETAVDIVELLFAILAVPETFFIAGMAALYKPFKARLAGQRQFLLFACAFILIASVLAGTIDFVGGYEYFGWYSRCIILIFTGMALAYAMEKRHMVVVALGVGLLLVGAYHMKYFLSLKSYGRLVGTSVNQTLYDEPTATMDANEWNGLLWASRNLPRDAVMISNRTTCVYTYRHGKEKVIAKEAYYSYAAFSGMQSWTHDTEWTQNIQERDRRLALVRRFLASTNPEEQAALLLDIPCQYFLQCLRFDQKSYDSVPGLKRVFANPSMLIYRVEPTSIGSAQEGGT